MEWMSKGKLGFRKVRWVRKQSWPVEQAGEAVEPLDSNSTEALP